MSTNEQPKVKLYWLSQSRSQRIVWLLEELGIPYTVELFHRNKQTFLAPPELEAIHPLGKSPMLEVTGPGPDAKPILLAESGLITQYLCEHFPAGRERLTPKRWKDGQEGQVGGETEAWLRWAYYLHYNEGSFMPLLVLVVILSRLKSPMVPFFLRPITSGVADRIYAAWVYPNARRHMTLIDQQLASAPDGGPYLCGRTLTAADILMSFPLIGARQLWKDIGPWKGGSWEEEFPRVRAYVDMLEADEGYKRSLEKVEEMEGGPQPGASL